MTRRITKDEIEPAIRAWAHVIGHGGEPAETLPRALGWLRELWEAGLDTLPLDLVHDLGMMLVEGRAFPFASGRDLADWPEEQRSERLEYEDRILGRWILDPTLAEANVAIAALGGELRPRAIAHAIGLALGPAARAPGLVAGNPAHLRARARELAAALAAWPPRYAAWEAPPCDDAWREWAIEHRRALAQALGERRLFTPEDLWEIAHLEALPSESARLALREIHRARAAIGGVSPGLGMLVRRRAQEVPVDDDDASHYPAGGFDALANRGRFENLVRSEVGYVGEGQVELGGGIDLFDVRFAQGELVYYTRDESPLFDQRRELNVVIDRPSELRHKHPELDAQTLVLADAAALRLQADLIEVFGPSGALVNLRWRPLVAADAPAIDEERALLSLTLADEIAHGRVTLETIDSFAEASTRGLVIFSIHPRDPRAGARAWVRVGEPTWVIDDEAFFDVRVPGEVRAALDEVLRRCFE
ncbi:MAG: hypothetical protein H6711_17945 [Myxococcales bacterium]|nr:hypothetical protein [Myxococcales bacterium]